MFDLRWLIGGLFTVYGVLLTVVGMFDPPGQVAKAQGVRINLWVGLGMLVLGLLFLLWRLLSPDQPERPAGVPEQATSRDEEPVAAYRD